MVNDFLGDDRMFMSYGLKISSHKHENRMRLSKVEKEYHNDFLFNFIAKAYT